MKNLAFPKITDIAELFTDIKPYSPKPGDPESLAPSTKNFRISHFCSISNDDPEKRPQPDLGEHYALKVVPSRDLINFIINHMTLIDGDTMYFELIPYEDGTSLVVVKYNRIIGQRYLAVVKTPKSFS